MITQARIVKMIILPFPDNNQKHIRFQQDTIQLTCVKIGIIIAYDKGLR